MSFGEFGGLIPYSPIRPNLEQFLEIGRGFYEFLVDVHWNDPTFLGKIRSLHFPYVVSCVVI